MNKISLMLSLLITTLSASAQKGGEYIDPEKPDLSARLFAPDFISTDNAEKAAFFHPNGKEFYFTREGEDGFTHIMFSKRDGSTWTAPEVLPIPNKESFRAFVTKDGLRMYFASIDSINEQDSRREYNIWVMDRANDGWENPRPLGAEINTPDALEMHPSVADDGTLYFKRLNFQDETEKIFYAEWKDAIFASKTF